MKMVVQLQSLILWETNVHTYFLSVRYASQDTPPSLWCSAVWEKWLKQKATQMLANGHLEGCVARDLPMRLAMHLWEKLERGGKRWIALRKGNCVSIFLFSDPGGVHEGMSETFGNCLWERALQIPSRLQLHLSFQSLSSVDLEHSIRAHLVMSHIKLNRITNGAAPCLFSVHLWLQITQLDLPWTSCLPAHLSLICHVSEVLCFCKHWLLWDLIWGIARHRTVVTGPSDENSCTLLMTVNHEAWYSWFQSLQTHVPCMMSHCPLKSLPHADNWAKDNLRPRGSEAHDLVCGQNVIWKECDKSYKHRQKARV